MKKQAKNLQPGDHLTPVIHWSSGTIRRPLYEITNVIIDPADGVEVFIEGDSRPIHFSPESIVTYERVLKR